MQDYKNWMFLSQRSHSKGWTHCNDIETVRLLLIFMNALYGIFGLAILANPAIYAREARRHCPQSRNPCNDSKGRLRRSGLLLMHSLLTHHWMLMALTCNVCNAAMKVRLEVLVSFEKWLTFFGASQRAVKFSLVFYYLWVNSFLTGEIIACCDYFRGALKL